MAVYIFTGKLGGGKTLCSVGRIKEYIQQGRTIATNLDLNLGAMFRPTTRDINLVRIPDKPTVDDLKTLGIGNASYDETKNGLIVLDECGTWFNSRNWNDKTRKDVNDWFLHARKLGWDVILIIQDINILDSQARDALAEHTVFCKRLDRLQIPLIGGLFKAITGFRLGGPRVHSARCVYGTKETDLLSDRWIYRGNDLFKAYDTKQLFLQDYPHGVHSVLTPWHTHGRYQSPRNPRFYMRLTHIYLKKFRIVGALTVGSALGAIASFAGLAMFASASTAQPVEIVQEKTAEKQFDQGERVTSGIDLMEEYENGVIADLIDSMEYFGGYIGKPNREDYLLIDNLGNLHKYSDFADLGIIAIRRGNTLSLVHGEIHKIIVPKPPVRRTTSKAGESDSRPS